MKQGLSSRGLVPKRKRNRIREDDASGRRWGKRSQWYFCGGAKLRPWPQSKRRSAAIFGQFPSKQSHWANKKVAIVGYLSEKKEREANGRGLRWKRIVDRPLSVAPSNRVAIASIISLRFSTTVFVALLVDPIPSSYRIPPTIQEFFENSKLHSATVPARSYITSGYIWTSYCNIYYAKQILIQDALHNIFIFI